MHLYVQLAKEAIEEYALSGRIKELSHPLPPELQARAGVFVSIKKRGQLRGCIGSIEATEENLAQEIISNALKAASQDPRFLPVRPEELPELEYSVDVLEKPEKISSSAELDPQKYGLIVEKGWRRGLLLPALEGINTVEEQLAIAKRKAGIPLEEKVTLYRFRVKRYK